MIRSSILKRGHVEELINDDKLSQNGIVQESTASDEDARSAALALRARKGDFDEGTLSLADFLVFFF